MLTQESIYVYASETSKTPKSTFSLHGYNRVTRCEVKGQDWCFSIVPAEQTGDATKPKTFACCSDADRIAWMQAIKNQIYTANNIPKPVLAIIDKLKSMTTGTSHDEEDYTDVEHVVYEPNQKTVEQKNSDDEDDDIEEEESDTYESDDEKTFPVCMKTKRSMSLPHNSLPFLDSRISAKSLNSDYETCDDVLDALLTRKQSSDPKSRLLLKSPRNSFDEPSRPPSEIAPRPPSDPVTPPPRYSEVLEEEKDEEPHYVNLPCFQKDQMDIPPIPQKPSLESLCTVSDYINREQLNALLQAKQKDGTYLIRKSRTSNYKVIAFLQNGHVTEYKIFENEDQVSIDRNRWFSNTEELLHHYTSVDPLPCMTHFLKRGFHQVRENET